MMFNAVAVKDKKALSIQLTTKVEFKSLVSFILRSALELCVPFHVYIFFFSKLADHCSKVRNHVSDSSCWHCARWSSLLPFFSGNIRKDFWNCSYDLSHNISSFLDTNDELLFKALASLMDVGEAENKELILWRSLGEKKLGVWPL